eukprot:scaffold5397_cov126-Skeletonema_marinoi.AAC.1
MPHQVNDDVVATPIRASNALAVKIYLFTIILEYNWPLEAVDCVISAIDTLWRFNVSWRPFQNLIRSPTTL